MTSDVGISHRPILEALEERLLYSATVDIVLVDSALADQELLEQAATDVDRYFVFDSHNDSASQVVAEVTRWAEQSQQQIDSLSIISHGAQGQFQLGQQTIDSDAVSDNSDLWAQLGDALSDDANIYLYGCDTGQGEAGQSLLDSIADAAGADVFASDDVTGKDGDWQLEVASANSVDELDTLTSPLDTQLLKAYAANLADTGWKTPGAVGATSEWTNSSPAYVQTDNNSYAEGGVGETQDYANFGFDVSVGVVNPVITGIEVSMQADTFFSSPTVDVQLSWDGGSSWTSPQELAWLAGFGDSTESAGSSSNSWGHNWQASELDNSNFRLRIINTDNSSTIDLDLLEVKVHYAEDVAPTATSSSSNVLEDELVVVTLAGSDPDGGLDQIDFYRIDSLPSASDGELRLNGVAVNLLDTISQVDIDAGLLRFTPASSDWNGSASFQFSANDGQLWSVAQATYSINVEAIDDAPVNSVPTGQTVVADNALIFSVTNGNNISVSDVDATGNDLSVTLVVGNGTVSLATIVGLNFTAGNGAGDGTMSFSGSVADINNALDGMQFDPGAGFSGTADITITTTDTVSSGTNPLDVDASASANYDFESGWSDSLGNNANADPEEEASIVTDPERGNVLYVDGNDDHVRLPVDLVSGQTGFSLSVWVRTTESGTGSDPWDQPTLLGFENEGDLNDLMVTTSNGYIGIGNGLAGGVDESYLSTTTQINDNLWHLITLSADDTSGTLSLYVDGQLETTLSAGSAMDSEQIFIGAQNDTSRFFSSSHDQHHHQGYFDEFRVFDDSLSAGQVADLYSGLLSQTDTIDIDVVANAAPVVGVGQAFNYDENTAAGVVIGQVIGSDDIAIANFQFYNGGTPSQISSDGFFSINNTGEVMLTVAATATGIAQSDYETGANSFNYSVVATDSQGLSGTGESITLSVNNIDDTAPVITAGQSFSYEENLLANTQVAMVAAIDTVGVTGFQFENGGSPAATSADGFFIIDNTGVVRITAAGVAAGVAQNDYETGLNSFDYMIVASDAQGNQSDGVSVGLQLIDIDDIPPVVTPGQSFSYVDNQLDGSTIATVLASDDMVVSNFQFYNGGSPASTSSDGYFAIDSGGSISLTASGVAADVNDFGTLPNSFNYDIVAIDGAMQISAAESISFIVFNSDVIAPVISAGQNFSYDENTAAATVIATVVASDAVGVTRFQFDNSGSPSAISSDGFYSIDNGGVVSLTAAGAAVGTDQNDFETGLNSFAYAIVASDSAGNNSAVVNITLNVNELDDTAPTVSAGQSFNYDENQLANSAVATVLAIDAVGVSSFQFNNAGSPSSTSSDGYFTIDNSGVVRITASGVAVGVAQNDFESGSNSFNYDVIASDAAGNNSAVVSINLALNELDDTAPVVVVGQSFNYDENQLPNAVIATMLANDAVAVTGFQFYNGGLPSSTSSDGFYSVDNSGDIRLTASGAAAGVAQNDYENGANSFNYTLVANDAAGNTSSAVSVTFVVNETDDTAPVIAAGQNFNYDENQLAGTPLATVSATDGIAVTGFQFYNGGSPSSTSSDGYYAVNNSGVISLTAVGAAVGVAQNDYETGANSFNYTLVASDAAGNASSAVSVTLVVNETDDTAPVIPAGQSFSYDENQLTGMPLATVLAADTVAVTDFYFYNGGVPSSLSNDGFYTISSSGDVELTAAGSAAAQNDYETGANSFNYDIVAFDAEGNQSAAVSVSFNINETDDTAPIISAGQNFYYVEDQEANTLLAQVVASDSSGVVDFKFENSGSPDSISADGFFAINSSGELRLTVSGAIAGANDYDLGANTFSYNVIALDDQGNASAAEQVVLNLNASAVLLDPLPDDGSDDGTVDDRDVISGNEGSPVDIIAPEQSSESDEPIDAMLVGSSGSDINQQDSLFLADFLATDDVIPSILSLSELPVIQELDFDESEPGLNSRVSIRDVLLGGTAGFGSGLTLTGEQLDDLRSIDYLWGRLDEIDDEVTKNADDRFELIQNAKGFGAFSASLASAWVLRAAALSTSLFSALPAWRSMDVVAVLNRHEDEGSVTEDDEDDEIEPMFTH